MAVNQTRENRIGKGKAGPGRPKGSANKVNADIRSMVRGALDEAGGQTYLRAQAQENPKAFLTLIAKLIPTEITGGLEINGKVTFYLPSNHREQVELVERPALTE